MSALGSSHSSSRLIAEHVDLAYIKDRPVAEDLSISIPHGQITALIGPNACGKSTLLRALARLLAPVRGAVYLDGQAISSMSTKRVAATLGLLPQSPTAPEGITVEDLVARGRYPHQRLFQQWSRDDAAAVDEALELTGTAELRQRQVDELSGGQRQRAWIAMALAQQTDLLLLDEPTTFLDLAHRVEVLDLLANLNEQKGRTVVMVLHELNEACRYADHVVTMHGGQIQASGDPQQVITAELVEAVFGLECQVVPDPITGTPLVLPRARRR